MLRRRSHEMADLHHEYGRISYMEHGAHLGILGDNPLLILAAIFLLGFLIVARLSAPQTGGSDQAADGGVSAQESLDRWD
jgi:hypothetical protein